MFTDTFRTNFGHSRDFLDRVGTPTAAIGMPYGSMTNCPRHACVERSLTLDRVAGASGSSRESTGDSHLGEWCSGSRGLFGGGQPRGSGDLIGGIGLEVVGRVEQRGVRRQRMLQKFNQVFRDCRGRAANRHWNTRLTTFSRCLAARCGDLIRVRSCCTHTMVTHAPSPR